MTDLPRTYTIIFTLAPDAVPPDRARRFGDVWSVEFGETEFASIPAIRREVLASRGLIVHENGAWLPVPHDPARPGTRVVLASENLAGRLTGVERSSAPCPACGLPVVTVVVGEPALAVDDPPALSQSGGLLVIAARVRERLVRDGLAEGADFLDVAPGASVVLPTRRLRAGRGPSPACEECGRTTVTFNGVARPAPARYAIAHSASRPTGEGWWAHPATGDAIGVVSPAVARVLDGCGARFREQPVADVTDASAWLEEEWR